MPTKDDFNKYDFYIEGHKINPTDIIEINYETDDRNFHYTGMQVSINGKIVSDDKISLPLTFTTTSENNIHLFDKQLKKAVNRLKKDFRRRLIIQSKNNVPAEN